MLEVVEQKEQLLVADLVGDAVISADRLAGRLEDQLRIAQRRERNPENAVGKALRRLGRRLEGEPRLARPAGPREREQARLVEEVEDRRELVFATEEGSRRNWQVRAIQRLQQRKVPLAELQDPLRRAQILEPVLAQIPQLLVDERRGRSRDEDLPAVAGRGDSGGAMDVGADVTLGGDKRRAVWMPIRTGIASASWASRAAATASAPRRRRRRRRRPACRPRRRRGARTPRAEHAGVRRGLGVALGPSSCSSFVDPSTSVKRNVTVPVGREPSTGASLRR